MDPGKIVRIVEAALMAADRPLDIDALQSVFGDFARPDRKAIRDAIASLQEEYAGHAMEIKEVASGFRIQVRTRYTEFISRLWEEKPPRYSRALMETLALIAYRQPITRGEIEEVRGVTVSTNIVRTLMERSWIRVVGHRDVPGRPAMFGTTKEFLDYFGLRKLEDLPTLAEIRDLDEVSTQLELPTGDTGSGDPGAEAPATGAREDDTQEDDRERHAGPQNAEPPRMRLVTASTGDHSSSVDGQDNEPGSGDEETVASDASSVAADGAERARAAESGDESALAGDGADAGAQAGDEPDVPAEESDQRDLARQS